MFEPEFRYANKMVQLLTRISAAREIVLSLPLIPRWEITLRREAIIHSAHASTSIEGNRLSLEQVGDLAQEREVIAPRKGKQEILNYLNVLEKIGKLAKGEFIDEQDIFNIHGMLIKNTLDSPSDCGMYRTGNVVAANRLAGEVYFRLPKNKDVPGLIKNLLKWVNSHEARELDPVLEAGIVHYEFVRIHPFVDGNGRTARVPATLILYLRGSDCA